MQFLISVLRQKYAAILIGALCGVISYGALKAGAFQSLRVGAFQSGGVMTERDQCVSNLRGLAELNGAKQGFKVVQISKGSFSELSDGGIKCEIQFAIMVPPNPELGIVGLSRVYKGEVFGNGKISPVIEITDN